MAKTLLHLHVHLVWSVRDRQPLFEPPLRAWAHGVLAAALSVAELVQSLKGASSRAAGEHGVSDLG